MKDIRLGLDRARNVWHSISEAQRKVLLNLYMEGGSAWRDPDKPTQFLHPLNLGVAKYGVRTLENLVRRELLAWAADDPTGAFKAVLTEHGRFVVRRGSGKWD